MKLIYDSAPGTGSDVEVGDRVTSSRNEEAFVTGWKEPQHAGSTGRVYVKFIGEKKVSDFPLEYFPSVFDLKFVEKN
jgi:hypothetical protein